MILKDLVVANLKIIFRNRQSLFWALAFPLIFVGVFGLFNLDETPTTTIGVIDRSQDRVSTDLIRSLDSLQTFEVEFWDDEALAREELEDGEFRYLLVIPRGLEEEVEARRPSGIQLIFDEASPTSAIVIGVINSFLDDVNLDLAGTPPLLNLQAQGIRASDLDYFDFLLPGFVGMGVMTYSIIGLATVLTTYREQKILKRILATPLKVRSFFAALILAHLVLALIQTAVILAAGVWILNGDILGNVLYIGVFVLLGNIVFLSIGFIVGSVAKNVAAASGLGNAVAMPMMFLSGVFFPTDTLPGPLEKVVNYSPLAQMLEAMRGVSLDARPLTDFPAEIGVILAWIAVTGFIAIRMFRFG